MTSDTSLQSAIAMWIEARAGRIIAAVVVIAAWLSVYAGVPIAGLAILTLGVIAVATAWDTDTQPDRGDD